ncbi:MAG: hypothetical protein R3326_00835 [Gemmatimonadota bacterium]|nr:hypothetical protein [Gemmatimonadota bacterium]
MEGRVSRSAARRAVALALVATAGCASAPPRDGGPFVAAGFSADQLSRERVAVLPVDAVVFPDGLPETVDGDSLAEALGTYGSDVLAKAVGERGAAARAVGPGVLGPALLALGAPVLDRAYEALLRAPPGAATDGRLPAGVAEDYDSLSRAVGARFFLVPLRLSYEPVEPLQFDAELEVALVDAGAGRIVWRAAVSAHNPVPPPGDAADLYAAALEDATSAVADRAARRLSTVGDIDPDEPIEDVP